MSKRSIAIDILKHNFCMIDGVLSKAESTVFKDGFSTYLIDCLNTLTAKETVCIPHFITTMSTTCDLYRCTCGHNLYLHYDLEENKNEYIDKPKYCSNCGRKLKF